MHSPFILQRPVGPSAVKAAVESAIIAEKMLPRICLRGLDDISRHHIYPDDSEYDSDERIYATNRFLGA